MNRKTRFITLALLAGIAATELISFAGDLNPPVGPVAPTHKTLTEVEPRIAINATNTPGDADSLFKITAPGSYYLTGNITGVAGKNGIEIVASGVTLDLMGFDLAGVPAMGAFDGVSATVLGLTNITVVNGSIRNWGDEGVDLATAGAITNCRVTEVLASGNAGNGISASSGCTVTNCSASDNTGSGISIGAACTVTNCSVQLNGGTGISSGIGCTMANCSAYGNTGDGIFAGNGSTVTNCSARTNTLDGIRCNSSSMIRGNTCASSGNGAGDGASIHATGSDNRIEGNNCTSADRGIDVDAAGNIIIKNTCSGNTTNWDVVVGNVCLVVQGVASPAILGNAGGVAPGSTDPNANFTY